MKVESGSKIKMLERLCVCFFKHFNLAWLQYLVVMRKTSIRILMNFELAILILLILRTGFSFCVFYCYPEVMCSIALERGLWERCFMCNLI